MIKWCDEYYNNYVKNYLLKMLHKYCSNQLDDLCVLDTTLSSYWIDFYLHTIQAPIVTSLGNTDSVSYKYLDINNYDFLRRPLYESIGPFINQYNVVHVLDSFTYEMDDNKWKKSVDVLCSYLKKDGFMIVSGNLQTMHTSFATRDRSEGLWRAVINNSNCSIKSFVKMPVSVFTDIPHDILIVGKK